MAYQANVELAKELKSFGRRLAEKRREKGKTKPEFAKECGLSYKHYFNIECGDARPSLLTYIAICRALGVSIPLVGP